jgi:hypothetical protein
MKRNAVTSLLVAILVLIALVLGVANKSRTDIRARKVADSLNRKGPPKGPLIHEMPGTVSTAEPGRPDREGLNPTPDSTGRVGIDPYRIDLAELRKAVLAGDLKAVEDIRGNFEPEDAATLYELLFLVPSGLAKEVREGILSALTVKLQQTRGDEAARLLFDAVLREGLIPDHQWQVSVHVLGQKRYKGAQSFLEELAFSRNETDKIFCSGSALLLIAPESTMNRLKEGLRSAPDPRLSGYLNVMWQANSLPLYYPDLAPVIPILKDRFRARAGLVSSNRTAIATLLTDYAVRKDPDLKGWLKIELQNAIASPVDPDWESEKYRGLLKSLE